MAGSCGSRPPTRSRRRRGRRESTCARRRRPASTAADSILHSPRKRTPSASRAARAASDTRGRKRASGRSSMSRSGDVVRSGERRGRFGADQSRADDDHPPARSRELLDEGDEAGAEGVLLGVLEAREWAASGSAARSPRRSSALRARSGRRRQRATTSRCAVEIAAGHDAVDVLGCLARRAGRRRRAAERGRSGARASRAAAGRGAGPARSCHARASLREAGRARVPATPLPTTTTSVIRHTSADPGSGRVGGTADQRTEGKTAGGARRVADARTRAGASCRNPAGVPEP